MQNVPRLHILIQPFITVFLSCQILASAQNMSPTLFMTLIEYLISQGEWLKVLVSKNSRQNLNLKMQKIFTTKILNYESLNRIIQFL